MKNLHFFDALAEALIIELRTLEAQDKALEELAKLEAAMREHEDIRDRLLHASLPLSTRLQLLEKATHEHIQPPVQRAILILLRERALGQLSRFIERLKHMRRRLELARDVTVQTATPLLEAEKKRLKSVLEKKWGLSVTITEHVDTRIIGGLRISAGDWQYDATIRGKLTRLSRKLKS